MEVDLQAVGAGPDDHAVEAVLEVAEEPVELAADVVGRSVDPRGVATKDRQIQQPESRQDAALRGGE